MRSVSLRSGWFGSSSQQSSIYLSFVNFTRVLWLFLIVPAGMQFIRAYAKRRRDRQGSQGIGLTCGASGTKFDGTDPLEIKYILLFGQIPLSFRFASQMRLTILESIG